MNSLLATLRAISIFRDVTTVSDLSDQNIALKKIQSLLEAIINASEDAISVVDETGCGIIINPAYTP
jgi:transcriptional regulator with PAS, ATPase and Fis domain